MAPLDSVGSHFPHSNSVRPLVAYDYYAWNRSGYDHRGNRLKIQTTRFKVAHYQPVNLSTELTDGLRRLSQESALPACEPDPVTRICAATVASHRELWIDRWLRERTIQFERRLTHFL
jgi:hypothetical protein